MDQLSSITPCIRTDRCLLRRRRYAVCQCVDFESSSIEHISELEAKFSPCDVFVEAIGSLPSCMARFSSSVVRSSLRMTSSTFEERSCLGATRTRSAQRGNLTGSIDPFDVIVVFTFDLLLPTNFEECPTVLDAFPLLGEFSATSETSTCATIERSLARAYPLRTPSTRLSMKNEPRIINGTK